MTEPLHSRRMSDARSRGNLSMTPFCSIKIMILSRFAAAYVFKRVLCFLTADALSELAGNPRRRLGGEKSMLAASREISCLSAAGLFLTIIAPASTSEAQASAFEDMSAMSAIVTAIETAELLCSDASSLAPLYQEVTEVPTYAMANTRSTLRNDKQKGMELEPINYYASIMHLFMMCPPLMGLGGGSHCRP